MPSRRPIIRRDVTASHEHASINPGHQRIGLAPDKRAPWCWQTVLEMAAPARGICLVGTDQATSAGGIQNNLDPAAHARHGFRHRCPDRIEDCQHLLGREFVHWQRHDAGGIPVERCAPLFSHLRLLPSCRFRFEVLSCHVAKGADGGLRATCRLAAPNRISASGNLGSGSLGKLAGLGEPDSSGPAEAHLFVSLSLPFQRNRNTHRRSTVSSSPSLSRAIER